MHEILPVSRWLSLDNGQVYAEAMLDLQLNIIKGMTILKRLAGQAAKSDTEIGIHIHGGGRATELPEGSLMPDESLLPLWMEFADALSSLATHQEPSGYIILAFSNIQLPRQVFSILESALKAAPLNRLLFINNRLQYEGIKFAERVLEANRTIRVFSLCKNSDKCELPTLSLAEAARNHPRLQVFHIKDCDIGPALSITPEKVPALLSLKSVSLKGNHLGSQAASLIANCLATNPHIKILDLDDNLLNDEDATLIANSLKTNTNLRLLFLRGNKFTDAGIKTLLKSVHDDESLNAIQDSNHTCRLKLFADGAPIPDGVDEAVLSMNGKDFKLDAFPAASKLRWYEATDGSGSAVRLLQMEGRRKMKMLHTLQGGNTGRFNIHHLNGVSVKLVPKVLAFTQEGSKYTGTENRNLDSLFQVLRSRPAEIMSFHSEKSNLENKRIAGMNIDKERCNHPQCKKRRIC